MTDLSRAAAEGAAASAAPSLASRAETVELLAYEDVYAAAPRDFARDFGLEHRRIDDGLLMIIRRLDAFVFNRLAGIGREAPARASAIDEAAALFESAGVTSWVVQAAPGSGHEAEPAARGFTRHPRVWAKLVHGGESPPAARTELAVREIGRADALGFGAVFAEAFGLPIRAAAWGGAVVGRPGWRTFAAFDGRRTVAIGALFMADGAAWLGMGGTLPTHRRRGAQSALLAARVAAAQEAGAGLVSVETGIPHPGEPGSSLANIERAGFRLAYERPSWRPPGGAQPAAR